MLVGASGNSAGSVDDDVPAEPVPHPIDATRGLDEIGVQNFHLLMVLVLGVGNASDAVEILGIGYILSNFVDAAGAPLTDTEREVHPSLRHRLPGAHATAGFRVWVAGFT